MEYNFHHQTKRRSSLALKPIFVSGSSGLKWHSQKWQTPLKPVWILEPPPRATSCSPTYLKTWKARCQASWLAWISSIRRQPPTVNPNARISSVCLANNAKCPDEVAAEMMTLVDITHSHFGIKHVVLCQIIGRAQAPTPIFNANAKAFSDILGKFRRYLPQASFWCHKGLRKPKVNIFLKDGVHLNDRGLYSLYRSYRGAILHVHKSVTRCESP